MDIYVVQVVALKIVSDMFANQLARTIILLQKKCCSNKSLSLNLTTWACPLPAEI